MHGDQSRGDAPQSAQNEEIQKMLMDTALNQSLPPEERADALNRITDPNMLLSVALEIDMREIPDVRLDAINNPKTLRRVARDAKSLRIREEALRHITDTKALFNFVCADIPGNFTRDICARLNELDADWAQRLNDTAVETLTRIIANNKLDEQFDYRHIADALKSVYRKGRAKADIEGLYGKAVAHLDFTGKEYRDKWCHQDGDYIYFNVLPEHEEISSENTADENIKCSKTNCEKITGDDPKARNLVCDKELKAIALNYDKPLRMREDAGRRIKDEDTLLSLALEIEKGDTNIDLIKDEGKLLIIGRDAKSLNMRKEALRRVNDAKALFETVVSDIPRYCTPEICARLDELDKYWAWQLNDAAVSQMICIIAENEKDEKFDYRPMAAALKQVYAKNRFTSSIEGLEKKAISHEDIQGKAYRDEWCHMDYGFTYFNLNE